MEKDNWEIFRREHDPAFRVENVVETEDCKVLKFTDRSGDGLLTLYPVFEGVYLMYSDFHMQSYVQGMQNAETFLCLEHCREGRSEIPTSEGSCFLEAGDLRIDTKVHHSGTQYFPLSHYHGITIGFERGKAEEAIHRAMPEIRLDFKELRERYHLNIKPYVLAQDEGVNHIFEELYHVPGRIRKPYYQIKVMELLLYLSALELKEPVEGKPYFYASQVEKVKAAEQLITDHMNQNFTIAELSERFDISETALKKCFSSMFGNSIYAYLKEARLNRAAALLQTESQKKVAEIALMVGYETPSKFAAAFKSMFGKTPGEYRKQIYPESRMEVEEI